MRKSTTSCSSSTASSAPATSANVFVGLSFDSCFAFDDPIPNMPPPACMRYMKKNSRPKISTIGSMKPSIDIRKDSCVTFVLYLSGAASFTAPKISGVVRAGY